RFRTKRLREGVSIEVFSSGADGQPATADDVLVDRITLFRPLSETVLEIDNPIEEPKGAAPTALAAPAAPVPVAAGAIAGVVTDEQGSPLPGVTVKCWDPKAGLTRTGVTNADGRYAFHALPPGSYTVQFELAG